MAKLAKPKAKDKPSAPKKPSSRSKTGNAACSEAASNWQLSLRGKAALSPDTYQTLAKCRAMNRTAKMAEAQGRTGKLSAMGESAVKGRLQSRFDSGLITQKARTERLDMLLKQRSEKQAEAFTETVRKSTPIKSYANYTSSGIKKIEDAAANSSNAAYRQKLEATAFEARMERQGEARYRLGIRDQRAIDWDQRERSLAIAAKVTYPKKLPGQLGLGFDVQPPTQPTAIVPTQPARYSLGGKLAPGRGTEERKDVAYRLKYLRKKTDSHVLIAGKLHTGEWEETESGSGKWKRKAFDPVAERRSLLSRFNDITEYDKKRKKARTLTRKANKLARYSLGGQLAPGRDTAERRKVAKQVLELRKATPEQAAAIVKKDGTFAMPSKYDPGRIAVKNSMGRWESYTPRQLAFGVIAGHTKASKGRLKKVLGRAGL